MVFPLETTPSACLDLLRIATIPALEKEDVSEALSRLEQLARKESLLLYHLLEPRRLCHSRCPLSCNCVEEAGARKAPLSLWVVIVILVGIRQLARNQRRRSLNVRTEAQLRG
jgi:hypothetical protein